MFLLLRCPFFLKLPDRLPVVTSDEREETCVRAHVDGIDGTVEIAETFTEESLDSAPGEIHLENCIWRYLYGEIRGKRYTRDGKYQNIITHAGNFRVANIRG